MEKIPIDRDFEEALFATMMHAATDRKKRVLPVDKFDFFQAFGYGTIRYFCGERFANTITLRHSDMHHSRMISYELRRILPYYEDDIALDFMQALNGWAMLGTHTDDTGDSEPGGRLLKLYDRFIWNCDAITGPTYWFIRESDHRKLLINARRLPAPWFTHGRELGKQVQDGINIILRQQRVPDSVFSE